MRRGCTLAGFNTQITVRAFLIMFFQSQDTEPGKDAQKCSQGTENAAPETRPDSVEKQGHKKKYADKPGGFKGFISVSENR
jgi:hypothetical protein